MPPAPRSTPVRSVTSPAKPNTWFGLPKWAVFVIAAIGVVIAYYIYKSSNASTSPGVPPQGGANGSPYDTNLYDQSALDALAQQQEELGNLQNALAGLISAGVNTNTDQVPNTVDTNIPNVDIGANFPNDPGGSPSSYSPPPVYVPPPPVFLPPAPVSIGAGGAYSTTTGSGGVGTAQPSPGGAIGGRGIQGGY